MKQELYHYTPSLIAASVAVGLFFLSTAVHTFQLLKGRTWYFIPFLIGGFFESIGYIGRIMASKEEYGQWSIGPYVLQSLLLLIAPTLLAASVYMVLGRIIRLIDGEKYSLVPTKWLTKIFVLGDLCSFMVQSTGGSVMAKATTPEKANAAQWIITAGLVLQVAFFGMFVAVTAVFHTRMARHPGKVTEATNLPWQQYLGVLYAVSGLILVRCIFRIVEYVQGPDGYLVSHEVFMYFFDSLMVVTAMALFNFWHPSKIIGASHKAKNTKDLEATESGTRVEANEI